METYQPIRSFKTHSIKLALSCQGVFKRGGTRENFGHWVDAMGEFESFGYEALFMLEVSYNNGIRLQNLKVKSMSVLMS